MRAGTCGGRAERRGYVTPERAARLIDCRVPPGARSRERSMRRDDGAMGDGAGDAAGGADLVDELRKLLAELSDGRLAASEIDPSANLFDFGYVDSLSGVMFLARIEEQWGVHIDDFDLVERLTTLGAVAARVREQR